MYNNLFQTEANSSTNPESYSHFYQLMPRSKQALQIQNPDKPSHDWRRMIGGGQLVRRRGANHVPDEASVAIAMAAAAGGRLLPPPPPTPHPHGPFSAPICDFSQHHGEKKRKEKARMDAMHVPSHRAGSRSSSTTPPMVGPPPLYILIMSIRTSLFLITKNQETNPHLTTGIRSIADDM